MGALSEATMGRKIGILTGGGDAPGLNAVIRAVVKYGVGQKGWSLLGIEDSFNGLLCDPYRVVPQAKGLLPRGGTVLGTTNRADPFNWPKTGENRSGELAAAVQKLGLEGLITLGGDGTQAMAWRLLQERGIPVVGVPKTIDNDLGATDLCFGFQSAVDCVTDALDRLHTTAESHDRVLLLEVMGRDAGWIALHGGIAGGVVLVSKAPSGSRNLTQYLFGSITTTSNGDLVVFAVLAAVVLGVVLLLGPVLFAVSNDEEFARALGIPVIGINILLATLTALTVVVSMRVVGVLLVSALMVVPVATAQLFAGSFRSTCLYAVVVAVVRGRPAVRRDHRAGDHRVLRADTRCLERHARHAGRRRAWG